MGFFDSETDWEFAPMRLMETPWGRQARTWMMNQMLGGVDYPTQRVAQLSGQEKAGLSSLDDILAGGSRFEDPSKSQYYGGLRDEMQRGTERGSSALRHRAQLGGMFSSGPGLREEGEYRAQRQNQSDMVLGGLYDQERTRENSDKYSRLAAAMSYGGLPRQIEQQGMNADYQKQIQDLLAPYQLQMPIANNLLGYAPWQTAVGTQQPSAAAGLGSIMGMVGQGVQAGVGAIGSIGSLGGLLGGGGGGTGTTTSGKPLWGNNPAISSQLGAFG